MRHKRHQEESDVELNITPIIDCFTVMVTFILASASFLAIGMIDVTVASEGTAQTSTEKPAVTLSLKVNKEGDYSLKTEGELNKKVDLKNDAELVAELKSLRERFSKVDGLIVSGNDGVDYGRLIHAITIAKRTHPGIALAPNQKN